jgi:hypothetical protein
MDQESIKYTNIFNCKTFQNLDFWFESKPSGNTGAVTPQSRRSHAAITAQSIFLSVVLFRGRLASVKINRLARQWSKIRTLADLLNLGTYKVNESRHWVERSLEIVKFVFAMDCRLYII